MHNIKKFLSNHKHFYLLFLFILLDIWFQYCERSITPKYLMHTSLDDNIPFVKEFAIPYIVWFFYVAYGLIYVGIYSKNDFYKLFFFVTGGMAACYVIYMLFPNGQDLRPMITQNDICSQIIKFLYYTDTPTNVCPSIHVFNSIAVYIGLRNSEAFSKKRWGNTISFIIMVSICFSTIFIKQHSVIDFMCGIALAIVFYIPIYLMPNVKQQRISYEKL